MTVVPPLTIAPRPKKGSHTLQRTRQSHKLYILKSLPSVVVTVADDCELMITVAPDVSAHINLNLTFADDLRHTLALTLGERSEVIMTVIESLASSATCNLKLESTLAAESAIHWQLVTIGAKEVTQTLRSIAQGEGATSSVDWIFYARGEEKYNLSARNIFNGREGSGEITIKGVAQEKAHAHCDGMIEIGTGGGGTNTYLTENVLMLDSLARVDAIPGLEIKTNDVKASHSATVSRVTAEDLFYFAARGINASEARRMYILGFLSDLAQRIPAGEGEAVLQAIEGKYRR